MKNTVFTSFLILSLTINCLAKQKTADEFLKLVRKPQLTDAWALMSGYVEHKRPKIEKDGKVVQKKELLEADIRLGIRFMSDSMIGQLIFDKKEEYSIGQNFEDGIAGTTVTQITPEKKEDAKLPDFGLRPSDLTLSFLYWKFEKEFESERISGQKCRVMKLKHPDLKESVKVWFSEKYAFPMKVEWYKDGKVKREATFSDFKEIKNEMVMIKRFKIQKRESLLSSSWETRVVFEDIDAAKMKTKKAPENLFLKEK